MSSASSLAVSLGHGNLVHDSFTSAAIGGSAVALFFLLIDAVGGTPLYTPSLLGSVLFLGAAPGSVSAVSLNMVAAYTAVHFAIFGLLGFSAALLVHAAERFSDPVLTLLLGFVAFEVGFVTIAWVLMPGVIETLGWAQVAVANLLATGGITFYLLRIRPRFEWHQDP